MVFTCASVSGGFFNFAGGIRRFGSSAWMRVNTSLLSGLPGTMAPDLIASSRTSSRSFALRAFSSGP